VYSERKTLGYISFYFPHVQLFIKFVMMWFLQLLLPSLACSWNLQTRPVPFVSFYICNISNLVHLVTESLNTEPFNPLNTELNPICQ